MEEISRKENETSEIQDTVNYQEPMIISYFEINNHRDIGTCCLQTRCVCDGSWIPDHFFVKKDHDLMKTKLGQKVFLLQHRGSFDNSSIKNSPVSAP